MPLIVVLAVTFDGNSIWDLTVEELSIQPGKTAYSALEALMSQYQFMCRIAGDSLECFVLATDPAAIYAFGQGASEHPTFFVDDEAGRSMPEVNHSIVVGSSYEISGEAFAADIIRETGRQFTRRISRKYITASSRAEDAAVAYINKVLQSLTLSEINCLPAFHLRVFDPVSYSSETSYISRIKERFLPGHQVPLMQTIKLTGLSGAAAGGGALPGESSVDINPAIRQTSRGVEF